ncbi:MAG: SEC-C domain-containing protein [Bryobacterales bacterium]|nr:SEC-C domain-containing protein [Bryobacterales bacterium]
MTQLTPAQLTVVQALATGATLTAAARLAAISRPTVYSWLNQPAFQKALAIAEHEHAVTVRDRLQSLSTQALDTLQALLNNPKSSPSVLLRASLAILNRKNWALPSPHVQDCEPATETLATEPAPAGENLQNEPGEDLATPQTAQTPRNASCPCGSGQKFKRCCGKDAPPVLNTKAA